MTIYACLDDRMGLLFNHRRQSRDAAVLEDIRTSLPGQLTIDPFSEKLIREAGIPCVQKEPEEGCHFFLENRPASSLLPLASKVVLYRWNRHYPADFRWDGDLSAFTLDHTVEFPGRSHETITKEVYTR